MSDIYQIGAPAFIPEQRRQLPRLLRESLDAVLPRVIEALEPLLDQPVPEVFLRVEEAVLHLFQVASSHVLGGVVAFLHKDAARVDDVVCRSRLMSSQPTRSRGWRSTRVGFLGGACLRIETPYVMEDLRGRRGKTRGKGRRRRSGTGSYPVLEALGISRQATPALQSEVARQAIRGASFDEACESLAERGIGLNRKTVRAITLHVGDRALEQRQERLDAAAEGHVFTDEFTGKRIVLSVDGGRMRMREGGLRGPRSQKGRRRYRTPWREPKLVSVYVIDKRGKKVRDRPMFYDGTLGDSDAIFAILAAELRLRGAAKAKEIIFTADGAPWIWNRIDALAESLGLDPRKIVRVADFYHAVEHLTELVELCSSWTPRRRKRWVCKQRRRLKNGDVDLVIQAGRDLCRGRNAAKIRTQVEYFVERKKMMRYRAYRRRGIPLGSGAMESAVRRVINLRLKGPSMFWRAENAERMLHMRSYFKAGRWDELIRRVLYATPSGMRMESHAAAA